MSAAGWVCPACDRKIPSKVAECRCGFARPDRDVDTEGDDRGGRSRTRAILEGLALLAAVAACAYYYINGRFGQQRAAQTVAAATPAAISSGPVRPPRREPDAVGAAAPAVAPSAPAPAAASGSPLSLEDLVGAAMPALVRVETGSGYGSGFFVRPDVVLTNVHVVTGNAYVSVKRPDGSVVQAHVESKAPEYDIAVLRLPGAAASQAVLEMGSGIRVRPGQEVVALGTPLGLQNTVTRGIVSAQRQVGPVTLVQTDAAINPGNSGGPILNRDGQVVAIATMTVRPGIGQGLSFGVAIDHARALMSGDLSTRSAAGIGLSQIIASSPAAPSPVSPSDAESARTRGGRQFDQAIAQLARVADALDDRWRSFVGTCYRGQISGAFDRPWFALYDPRAMQGTVARGCEMSVAEIRQTADRIRDEVRLADEGARRADVYPGARRDTLRRHRLDYSGWER